MNVRPMKAADLDGVELHKLPYPLYGTPKIDGMRCLAMDNTARTSSLRTFPNRALQEFFGSGKWHGMDGEITVGAPHSMGDGVPVLSRTSSGVKSVDGDPDFHFWVFDEWQYPGSAYLTRHGRLFHGRAKSTRVHILEHTKLDNVDALLRFEQKCLAEGYEGIMARHPLQPYKYGRSTLSEMGLAKLKRFIDGEAIVDGIEEAVKNNNDAVVNDAGVTERRGGKAATEAKGMIGTILATNIAPGEHFGEKMRLGAGTMSHAERTFFFQNPHKIIGRTAHWRAFNYDIKDKLRFALFYGFRTQGD